MSRPPYSSTVAPRHLRDGVLARHVDVDGERPARAVGGDDLLGHLLGAVDVAIGDDDVRAARGEQARGRAADAARAAGDERDPAGELAARRRLRELVALERPVLDRERLALARASGSRRARRRRPRPRSHGGRGRGRSGPAPRRRRLVTIPTPGTSTTRGPAGSIGNWPRLVVEVALVVLAVPRRVLRRRRAGTPRRARPRRRSPGRTRRRAACAWC